MFSSVATLSLKFFPADTAKSMLASAILVERERKGVPGRSDICDGLWRLFS